MSGTKKILFVMPALFKESGYGLACTNLLEMVCENLPEVECRVLALGDEGTFPDNFKGAPLRWLYSGSMGKLSSLWFEVRLWREVEKAFREYSPDIVWFETAEFTITLFLIFTLGSSELRKRVLCRVHASGDCEALFWGFSPFHRARWLFFRAILSHIPWICFTNRSHMEFFFQNVMEGNIYKARNHGYFLMPNTICEVEDEKEGSSDLLARYGFESGKFFLTVSRLNRQGVAEKGVTDLIYAVRMLSVSEESILKDHKFVVVGDGDCRALIEAQAKELGLEEYFLFIPSISNGEIRRLLREARACIMPSRIDGCSMLGLEALCCGAPLLCASVGGLRDFVEDKVNGYTFPPFSPQGIAEAILKILKLDDASINLMREESLQIFSRKFSFKKAVAEFNKIISTIS